MGQTNPQYEALLRTNFHRDDVWRVYADWLEEAGEAREARLIRAGCAAGAPFSMERYGELDITSSGNFGELPALVCNQCPPWFRNASDDFHARVQWDHGFIRTVRLNMLTRFATFGALLADPSMRFVRSFAIEWPGTNATLEGAWTALGLVELAWVATAPGTLAPLRGHALPALESLTICLAVPPTREDLDALTRLDAPHLATFGIEAKEHEGAVFTTALGAPWFSLLRTAHFAVATTEGLNGLFASSEVLAGLGAGVSIALPTGLLDSDRVRVRRAWPLARVVPLIPPPRNGDDTGPRPRVNVKPIKAPADFRTLPPWGTKSGGGVAGSGIRFDDPASPGYFSLTHCADCGAADTRLIYSEYDRRDLNSFESQSFKDWEYECLECGRFTVCSQVTTH